MSEIMKFFGHEHKNIKRIVHECHTRYYDDVKFSEVFADRMHHIMTPVMECMCENTKHYKPDILHDYTNILSHLDESEEDSTLLYAIGIRASGTDSPREMEAWMNMESEEAFKRRYASIFFFFRCIDTDQYTGDPVKYIDLYELKLGIK